MTNRVEAHVMSAGRKEMRKKTELEHLTSFIRKFTFHSTKDCSLFEQRLLRSFIQSWFLISILFLRLFSCSQLSSEIYHFLGLFIISVVFFVFPFFPIVYIFLFSCDWNFLLIQSMHACLYMKIFRESVV